MSEEATRLPFEFTGTGRDYFSIWAVNLLLSIITLGVYSAWAKVRRVKFFYNNTVLDQSVFDYHADPKRILRGRLIVVPLLLAVGVASHVAPWLPYLAYLLLVPALVVMSLRFNAANTSYRGVRFRFVGTMGRAYWLMSFEILYVFLSLGFLFPVWRYRIKKYVMSHLRYGDFEFGFGARCGDFYVTYVLVGLVGMGMTIVAGALVPTTVFLTKAAMGPLVIAGVVAYLAFIAVVTSLLTVRNTNLVFNHLGIGPKPSLEPLRVNVAGADMRAADAHRLASSLKFWPYLRLLSSNWLLTVLTLGLYRPYAMVRMAGYRAACLALLTAPAVPSAVAQAGGGGNAFGSEATDTGDIDLGL